MAQGQKVLGVKINPALEKDIQKACGGICSKSRFAKQAIMKELAQLKSLSFDGANKTIPVDGYKTLSYCQTSDEDKAGIVTLYDLTASFPTHILVPFNEGGRRFYRDQNGYKWEYSEDDPEDTRDADYYPVFTEDGESKELPFLSLRSSINDNSNDAKQEKFISHNSSPEIKLVKNLGNDFYLDMQGRKWIMKKDRTLASVANVYRVSLPTARIVRTDD